MTSILSLIDKVEAIKDGLNLIPTTAHAMEDGYYPDELALHGLDYLTQCLMADIEIVAEGLRQLANDQGQAQG